jgi:ATP-binding cassette, subfamily B, bacterial PglK
VSRYENEKKLIKNFNEILLGIKDIILFNKKKYFFDNFQRSNSLANENILNFHVCQSIPRLMLELVGILVLILFVIFMLIIEKADSSRVISTISIFGLCSFRFIPSVNRIILASQNIKFSSKNVHELFDISENFELYNKLNFFNDLKNINFRESILLKNIKFLYDKKIILNNLNFVIPKNSIIGIYGESGSGKTTLVNIISGLIKPTNGEIWIDNQKINFEDILKSNLFSYLHQEPIILEDTLKRNIAFGETESQISDERVKLVIDQAQLNNFVNSLDDGMNTLIGERGVKISGGQKQRIGIARALYYKRQVLILDESTNALDLETENRIYKILYELKSLITTIIISHRFNSNHKLTKKFKILNGNLVEY